MPPTRTNFTDNQRAEIFALDRATCSFSGRSLWLIDYGIDPSYAIDWADHIVPASLGGPSTVENGAAASWYHNYLRGNSAGRLYLFHRGLPTGDYLWIHGLVPVPLQDQLNRFARLHPSDWFLNRAMWHLWVAAAVEHQAAQGESPVRRAGYYTAAALKKLADWRLRLQRDGVRSLEERDLLPRTMEPDQAAMYSARDMDSQGALARLVKDLVEPHAHAAQVLGAVADCQSRAGLDKARDALLMYHDIPLRIVSRLNRVLAQREEALQVSPWWA